MDNNKQFTEEDFLKPDFFVSEYIPVEADIEFVTEKKEELTQQQKDAWKEVYSFAHMKNRAGSKYNNTDIENLCKQFFLNKNKVEKAFQKVFAENKEEFGINDKPEIVKVEVWLRKHWEFAENVITQVAEFREKGTEGKFEQLNRDTIFRKLQHAGFKFPMDKLRSLLKSDFMPRYNPFIDYFEGLEDWDGVDHISKLANHVRVEDQEFFLKQFKKALVRCIGCSLYGVENRIVIVFVQEQQSTGKSTFLRHLNPFGMKYYTEAPIQNNKDTSFALAENFTYNIEELATASKMDVSRLKSIISTAIIKERKPHATDVIEQPRRANLWGSTNNKEFLTDVQNTRWLCFNLLSIDWNYKKNVDMDKVWGQAFALYKDASFDDQLDEKDRAYRDAKNKDYEVNDHEKELIKRHFRVCGKYDKDAIFVSNADIMDILTADGGNKLNSRFIGKNMVQLGFKRDNKRLNGHPVRGYYVIKKISNYKTDSEKTDKKLF